MTTLPISEQDGPFEERIRLMGTVMVLCCFVAPSFAQASNGLRIESRWVSTWDSGFSTTYVKGNFMRTEDCWGNTGPCGNPSTIYISDCGRWSVIRTKGTFYDTTQPSGSAAFATPTKASSEAILKVIWQSVDTGERKTILGYTARHIVTTGKLDLSHSTCKVSSDTLPTYNGWYIDPPYTNKCTAAFEAKPDFDYNPDCDDRLVVERSGTSLGFALQEREEYMDRTNKLSSGYVVTSIAHEELDPSLFARPNARPLSELHNRKTKVQRH
jgi:hypothetical protein